MSYKTRKTLLISVLILILIIGSFFLYKKMFLKEKKTDNITEETLEENNKDIEVSEEETKTPKEENDEIDVKITDKDLEFDTAEREQGSGETENKSIYDKYDTDEINKALLAIENKKTLEELKDFSESEKALFLSLKAREMRDKLEKSVNKNGEYIYFGIYGNKNTQIKDTVNDKSIFYWDGKYSTNFEDYKILEEDFNFYQVKLKMSNIFQIVPYKNNDVNVSLVYGNNEFLIGSENLKDAIVNTEGIVEVSAYTDSFIDYSLDNESYYKNIRISMKTPGTMKVEKVGERIVATTDSGIVNLEILLTDLKDQSFRFRQESYSQKMILDFTSGDLKVFEEVEKENGERVLEEIILGGE